jgi:uncharacterized protein (TIGR03118 family)
MRNDRVSAVVLFLGAAAISLSQSALGAYVQTNLTSDGIVPAAHIDPNLKNPWGISFSPTSPFWVSDQAAGLATLYNGTGAPVPLVVTIPTTGGPPPSGPTGTVFNSTSAAFQIPAPGNTSVKSTFLFDTLQGTIEGWNPGSNGGAGSAEIAATRPGAVYTGLALGTIGGSPYLYAANNAGAGGIDVYDSNFNNVSGTTFAGKFVDPNPIGGFSPFDIQNINGQLYVEYAAITAMGTPLPGGYIDVYDSSGNFLRRFATDGVLNAPWGITLAPSTGFGTFSGDILVGNFFAAGTINAFDSTTGAFLGTLTGPNGNPITNDFLWALDFGNGGLGFSSTTLYFTAGLNNQRDGLFGSIQAAPEPGALSLAAIGLLSIAGVRLRFRRTARQ